MANGWGKNGNSDRLYFLVKITADGDCLILERKAMTNLHSILKSRDITLSTKVRIVKAVVFPVVMYGCESWTIKKAKWQRIDAFELWCWRRLLRVPWTARRSNQSILKEISPEYSLEGLMLKAAVPILWSPMQRADSLEKLMEASQVAQRLKHLPAMQETWVQSLGQEDPLEKEMATHSSIIAWRIPWMEEPGSLQSTGSQRVRYD